MNTFGAIESPLPESCPAKLNGWQNIRNVCT